MFPYLPSSVTALLPASGSLTHEAPGGAAVAHGRQRKGGMRFGSFERKGGRRIFVALG